LSKVAISGAATGTATFTIESPATNTNRTLTLPDNTGTIITTASTFAGTGPAFRAIRTTNQSVNHNTYTKVQLNTETFDTANCYDNATNYRFTPNVAGYYQVNGVVAIQTAGSSTQVSQVFLYKNGSNYGANSDFPLVQVIDATAWGRSSVALTDIVYLNGSTDYIELFAYFFDYTAGTSKNLQDAQFSASLARSA
jgi:hypothetical protein